MEILTLELGDSAFAFACRDVESVVAWPCDARWPVRSLAETLGLPAPEPTRAIVVSSPRGAVAFAVPKSPLQRTAPPEALYRVPRLLRRFGAPPWVAGFCWLDGVEAVFVDLKQLAQQSFSEATP